MVVNDRRLLREGRRAACPTPRVRAAARFALVYNGRGRPLSANSFSLAHWLIYAGLWLGLLILASSLTF